MTERPAGKQPLPPHATKVFSGILFDVYHWEQELFDGSTRTFEKLKRHDSGFVIPVLPNGNLLITEDTQPGRDTVLTFPGGQIEPGEDAEVGVRRELLEETGYAPSEMQFWKAVNSYSKLDWAIFVFIARGLTKAAEPHPEAGEKIVMKEITFDEFIMLPEDPRFQNMEIMLDLVHARYDVEKKEALRKHIYG